MDGWEATRQIRKWELESCNLCCNTSEDFCPHKRLPIVAVTADVVVKTRSMCFSSGMDDYITKVILAYIIFTAGTVSFTFELHVE